MSLKVYINNIFNNSIELLDGCKFIFNEQHKTSSSFAVETSLETNLNECDYIEIVDTDTIFSGTILSIRQRNLGYSDLNYKIFDLSIASNADLITNVFCDLVFPDGSTVTEILNGGLLAKITDEGITIGTVDSFTSAVLEKPANLWGEYVSDVLDRLCEVSGAYWEITPDKVFNMRATTNRDAAPFILDGSAAVYDLEVQKDAYTLYSAVRVIGGNDENDNPVVARAVDATLIAQIKAQRGGTGIIEKIISDSSCVDISDAQLIADNFLAANKIKASTISFYTETDGFEVGQIMEDCDYSYYGVSGDYIVTEITATIKNYNGLKLVYKIQASTVAYRDFLVALVGGKLAKFTLGADTTLPVIMDYTDTDADFFYWYPSDSIYPADTLYPCTVPILSLSNSSGEYYRKYPESVTYNSTHSASFVFKVLAYDGNDTITAISTYINGTETLGSGELLVTHAVSPAVVKDITKYLQSTWDLSQS